MNGTVAPPELWKEAKNPEGRTYYYNTITKATQWTKPVELMSAAEVRISPGNCGCVFTDYAQQALSKQPWTEYKTPAGRAYWYNKETKQSSWEIPEVYKNAIASSTSASKTASS